MVNLTLSVPQELKKKMDAFPELNWSEIARQAIAVRIRDYEILSKISQKSKLTEKDALELGKLVNKGLSERYKKIWGLS